MQKKVIFVLGTFLISLSFLTSCYYDVDEVLYPGGTTCDSVSVDFQTVIKPMIEAKCATSGCHVSGTGRKVLSTDQDILDIVNDGRLEDRVVKRRDMPPVQPLSTCEVTYIKSWLAKSAPVN